MLKLRFDWYIRPTVHTTRSWKRSLSKTRLQTGRIRKHRLCVFVWAENNLEKEIFENAFKPKEFENVVFLWTNPKTPGFRKRWRHKYNWCVFKCLRRGVDGKRLVRFQGKGRHSREDYYLRLIPATSPLKSFHEGTGRRDLSHKQFTRSVLKNKSQRLFPEIQTGWNSWD